MKAWRTESMDVVSLVYADTRAQARAATQRAAKEAGYNVAYTDIRVSRAPDRDGPIVSFQQRKALAW